MRKCNLQQKYLSIFFSAAVAEVFFPGFTNSVRSHAIASKTGMKF